MKTFVSIVVFFALANIQSLAIAADETESIQCTSAKDVELTISQNAAPLTASGILHVGNQDIRVVCKVPTGTHNTSADSQKTLWKCVEVRNSDGLYRAKIYQQGDSAIIMAEVTLDQIFPLQPMPVATLGCHAL